MYLHLQSDIKTKGITIIGLKYHKTEVHKLTWPENIKRKLFPEDRSDLRKRNFKLAFTKIYGQCIRIGTSSVVY